MTHLSRIHSITDRILEANRNDYANLFAACEDLYQALVNMSGIDTAEYRNRENLSIETGNAIGLTWAAMCIKDLMRTKKFMNGTHEATSDWLQENPGKTAHVLYAGTGPFATLVLPLTARFTSDQIQFTLLEVNETSFECLQQLMKTLQLEKYIRHIEKADATKWSLPSNEPVDIFICEAIQQGLTSEPQVAIFKNILPQLPSYAIIIPEQITLKAALMNPQERMQEKLERKDPGDSLQQLDTIFSLNKESIFGSVATSQLSGTTANIISELEVEIPVEVVNTHPVLCILTEIIIYKQEELLLDESALTMPLKLTELNSHQSIRIKFQYQINNKPGIHFTKASY